VKGDLGERAGVVRNRQRQVSGVKVDVDVRPGGKPTAGDEYCGVGRVARRRHGNGLAEARGSQPQDAGGASQDVLGKARVLWGVDLNAVSSETRHAVKRILGTLPEVLFCPFRACGQRGRDLGPGTTAHRRSLNAVLRFSAPTSRGDIFWPTASAFRAVASQR